MSIHFPAHHAFPADDRRPGPADPKHLPLLIRLAIIGGGAAFCWCAIFFGAGLL